MDGLMFIFFAGANYQQFLPSGSTQSRARSGLTIYNISYGTNNIIHVYHDSYRCQLSHLELHQIWQKVDRRVITTQ